MQPFDSQSDLHEYIYHRINNKILTLYDSYKKKVTINAEKQERKRWIGAYQEQLADFVVLENCRNVGGVLPFAIDPNTNEGYFLFGIEKLRKSECLLHPKDYQKDYFYTDHSTGKLQVRQTLCHFHGFLDIYESFEQGASREGYEESRGVFGDWVDIWRAISTPDYYHIPRNNFNSMRIVSLGYLDEEARHFLKAKFWEMPVHTPCMAETYGLHFISVTDLYAELRRDYLRGGFTNRFVPCNLSNIEASIAKDSCWIRPFVQQQLSKRLQPKLPTKSAPSTPKGKGQESSKQAVIDQIGLNYEDLLPKMNEIALSLRNLRVCCCHGHLMRIYCQDQTPLNFELVQNNRNRSSNPLPAYVCCSTCHDIRIEQRDDFYFFCNNCFDAICGSCVTNHILQGEVGILPMIDLPEVIHSYPFSDEPLVLHDRLPPSALNSNTKIPSCRLCMEIMVDGHAYYASRDPTSTQSPGYFHVQCLLIHDDCDPNGTTITTADSSKYWNGWKIKASRDYEKFVHFSFFEDPLILQLINIKATSPITSPTSGRSRGVPMIRSIQELPAITPTTHEMLNKLLRLSEKVNEEEIALDYQRKHSSSDETHDKSTKPSVTSTASQKPAPAPVHVQVSCTVCHHPLFVKAKKKKNSSDGRGFTCYYCWEVEEETKKRAVKVASSHHQHKQNYNLHKQQISINPHHST
jgi:hypothetical protein